MEHIRERLGHFANQRGRHVVEERIRNSDAQGGVAGM